MTSRSQGPSAQLEQVKPSWVGNVNKKYVELAPATAACPVCESVSKRHSIRLRRVKDINLDSPCTITVRVGVYRCHTCNKFFRLQPDFVAPRKRYSRRAIHKACTAVGVDRTTFCGLKKRLDRDFHVSPAISTGYQWFHESADRIDFRDYETWAVQKFSGVMAIDELYDGFVIFVATDPLNDLTLSVQMSENANEQELLKFLLHLDKLGLKPQVVITDGSPLYRNTLKAVWPRVRHQLCVFHYLRTITKHVLQAIRRARKLAWRRHDHENFKLLRKNRYLFVTRPGRLTDEQVELLRDICEREPELAIIRSFMMQVFTIFVPGQSKTKALSLHESLLKARKFRESSHLSAALRTLRPETFGRAITYMDYANCPRTSNHVERANRYYRKRAKIHYRNRTKRAIWNMIKTDLLWKKANHTREPCSLRPN